MGHALFQIHNFSRKLKNLYFIRFLQVRDRFLGFLLQEIHCNYWFYDRRTEPLLFKIWLKVLNIYDVPFASYGPRFVFALVREYCKRLISFWEKIPNKGFSSPNHSIRVLVTPKKFTKISAWGKKFTAY